MLLVSGAGVLWAQAPNLTIVWGHYGTNTADLEWGAVPTATAYRYHHKIGAAAYGAWDSIGNVTVKAGIAVGATNELITFEVQAFVAGAWGASSNARSTKLVKVWPVSSDASCTTEGIDVLNGFNQPIRAGGNHYFHEGMDVHGTENVASECVYAPVSGLLFGTGGAGSNVVVNIQYITNGDTQYVQLNHLADALDAAVVDWQSVYAGQTLGSIKGTIWNTLSSHTHFHYWKDNDNFFGTTAAPHSVYSENKYKDPREKAPRVTNTNADADSLRFRMGPDVNTYFTKDTVCREVDIVAEANDPQSTDSPWAAPKSVGYFIERFDGSAWTNAVKTSAAPYVLIDSGNGLFGTGAGSASPLILTSGISDRDNAVKSAAPTTPADYAWEQWWTYQVTNTKGVDGTTGNVDPNECWATDARTGAPNDNGYSSGYNRARSIDETRFKDGKYRVNIRLRDWVNSPPDYQRELFVDNFRPYVKQCKMDAGMFHYAANWTWNGGSNALILTPNTDQDSICGELVVNLTFSETMKEVSLSVGSIGYNQTSTSPEANSNGEKWKFTIPSSLIGGNENSGPHKLSINGKDLNGNAVQGFLGAGNFSGNSIPKHQHDGTWAPNTAAMPDTIHKFYIKNVPIDVTFDVDSTKCDDSEDGKIEVTATGGKQPYKYSKDGGSTWQASGTFSSLKKGSYSIKVMDGDSCVVSKDTIVPGPSKLSISVSGGGFIPYCIQDGPPTITLSASASGGVPTYTYSWPGGTLSVSGSGLYTCNVTDKNGCTDKASVIVVFIPILCSRDPNDIVGPIGYGDPKWVSVNDNLPYMIRFENDPDFATAPAQRVVVEHYPDEDLNLFSARLGDFGFANQLISVPSNTTFYSQQLDMVDSLGVRVDVTAGIDVTNNKLFWIFESIDPATGLPPTDPLLGLLPVNDSLLHNGEGFVNFTIRPKSTSVTGDSILAIASIVFDDNDTIVTPEISNIIDAFPPISDLHNLPATADSTSFAVSWTAQDDAGGCGVRDYALHVSTNGGTFSLYQSGILDTSTVFIGQSGNTYSFFTLATDNVGNTEAMKTVGEDTITIQGGTTIDADGDGYSSTNDCNDAVAAINPAATEACNDIDDNCDGTIDNMAVCPAPATLANNVGATSAVLTWANLPCANSYSVRYRQKTGATTYGSWSAWVSVTTNTRTITGLLTNATYQWVVKSLCVGNESAVSNKLFTTGCVATTYYADTDGDSYGSMTDTVSTCNAQPVGYITLSGDCNDAVAAINPVAIEACNDIDDNCDGTIDNMAVCPAPATLTNTVGATSAVLTWANLPCADSYSVRYRQKTGATSYGSWSAWVSVTTNTRTITGLLTNATYQWVVKSICVGNESAVSNKLFTTTCLSTTYYADADTDGYGSMTDTVSTCNPQPVGYITLSGDCNDAVAAINPVATEACNDTDDNCDGIIDNMAVCPAPATLANAVGATSAILTWANLPCADSYSVRYRQKTSATTYGPWSAWVSVATNTRTLTGLLTNATYQWAVKSICVGNESAASNKLFTTTCLSTTYYADTDGDGYGSTTDTVSTCNPQPVGYITLSGDCNDAVAAINPVATEACNDTDDNCDGIIDNMAVCPAPATLANTVGTTSAVLTWANLPCADSYSVRYRQKTGATTYGPWSASVNVSTNTHTLTGLLNLATYQWAVKSVCVGNESAESDNLFTTTCLSTTYYADTDGDSYGSTTDTVNTCNPQPVGYITLSGDCNDAAAAINPTAAEACNDLDDNCDGIIDNMTVCPTPNALANTVGPTSAVLTWGSLPCADSYSVRYRQKTGATTYGLWSAWVNTATNSATITDLIPNTTYQWNVKSICINKESATAPKIFTTCAAVTYYADNDADTYGNPAMSVLACNIAPTGYVTNATDCNDNVAAINPAASEICDLIDNNCNTAIDEGFPTYSGYTDADGDGYGNPSSYINTCLSIGYVGNCQDCNDANAAINMNVVETTNSLDDDCDGLIDNVCSNVTSTVIVHQAATSVLIDWADINDASTYNLQYRVVGTSTFTPTPPLVSSRSYATLTDLLPSTNYEYRIRTKCGASFTPYATLQPFATQSATGLCNKPTLGVTNAISAISVKVWSNFEPGASKYHYRYRDASVNPPLWISRYTVGNTPNIVMPALVSGKTYHYQVRANCPTGWTGFSTVGVIVMPDTCVDIPALPLIMPLQTDTETQDADIAVSNLLVIPNPTTGKCTVQFQDFETADIFVRDFTDGYCNSTPPSKMKEK